MKKGRLDETQSDLFSGVSDVAMIRFMLADLHDDLPGKVCRLRYLTDLGAELGPGGTMMFGGHVTDRSWTEARSSFVHGNYIATVLLYQSLVENLLAAFLHEGLLDELSPRIHFDETLRRCCNRDPLTDDDVIDLKKLASLRNPLTHFRHFDDDHNLAHRSIATGHHEDEVLRTDAWFAISLAIRILAKKPFRLE